MATTIKVKKIGELPDYFRTYYKGIETNRLYCKTEFRRIVTWYTTDCNGGEPDCHVKSDIEFEVVE